MVLSQCFFIKKLTYQTNKEMIMEHYYCEWCGVVHQSVRSLVNSSCPRSPSKKHTLYEGSEKSQYTCKYCGAKAPSLRSLVNATCTKSPTKYHHAAL